MGHRQKLKRTGRQTETGRKRKAGLKEWKRNKQAGREGGRAEIKTETHRKAGGGGLRKRERGKKRNQKACRE